jgi:hypothetical protein
VDWEGCSLQGQAMRGIGRWLNARAAHTLL